MTPPPNILWFCTDQQRFDTIAALGNPHVNTPTIDSLVADGTAGLEFGGDGVGRAFETLR